VASLEDDEKYEKLVWELLNGRHIHDAGGRVVGVMGDDETLTLVEWFHRLLRAKCPASTVTIDSYDWFRYPETRSRDCSPDEVSAALWALETQRVSVRSEAARLRGRLIGVAGTKGPEQDIPRSDRLEGELDVFGGGDVAKRAKSEPNRLKVYDSEGGLSTSRVYTDVRAVLAAPKRRGPKPGTNDRFGDRALFGQLTRLMKQQHLSHRQAALKLAKANKVAGTGDIESRARRLAERYQREVLEKPKN
jgi:hypothetical protein